MVLLCFHSKLSHAIQRAGAPSGIFVVQLFSFNHWLNENLKFWSSAVFTGFFSGFSVRKLRSQRRTESGWREGQRENFLSTNTLCHLILNDWIVFLLSRASPVAQMVKNLPAMQETWVQSLGREDSLEKGMATHSSILTGRIPGTEEPGGLQSRESQRVGHDWTTNTFTQNLLNN